MISAVIIRGNPTIIHDPKWNNKAELFYTELKTFLEQCGVDVVLQDAGEPKTVPVKADLWIAHSRGLSRLQYAPKGTLTLNIDKYLKKNHVESSGKVKDSHFEVTASLKKAITTVIIKIKASKV